MFQSHGTVNEQQIHSWLNDEESCLVFLFNKRWPQGFQCPYCHWQHPPTVPTRSLTCTHCGHPSSITTNTIMHGSKKPLSQWLLTIWWLCANEADSSAKNLQRLLRLSSYQTAWTWLQKLRMAMGAADNTACQGFVEIACLPILPTGHKQQQAQVIAAAEIVLPAGIIGRIRMAVIEQCEAKAIADFLQWAVIPGSSVFAPSLPANMEPDRSGSLFLMESPAGSPRRAEQLIHRVEIWLNKVHRGGGSFKHLQPYLDEFCFRNNSSLLPNQEAIFNLLLQGALSNKPKPYRELISTTRERGKP